MSAYSPSRDWWVGRAWHKDGRRRKGPGDFQPYLDFVAGMAAGIAACCKGSWLSAGRVAKAMARAPTLTLIFHGELIGTC